MHNMANCTDASNKYQLRGNMIDTGRTCEYKPADVSIEDDGWYNVQIKIRPKTNGTPRDIPRADIPAACLEELSTIVLWMREDIRAKSSDQKTKRSTH